MAYTPLNCVSRYGFRRSLFPMTYAATLDLHGIRLRLHLSGCTLILVTYSRVPAFRDATLDNYGYTPRLSSHGQANTRCWLPLTGGGGGCPSV